MAVYFLCVAWFFASTPTLAQNFNFVPPWEQIGSVIGPVPEYRPLCELVILPSTMLEMNEGETLFLNCKANCRELTRSLHWEDNAGRRVPEVQPASRRYSNGARYWLGFLRLEIGNLQPKHEGNYLCKGYFAGNWIIRTTYLKIKPRYPATTVTPGPTTTTTTTTTTPAPTTTMSTTTSTSSSTPSTSAQSPTFTSSTTTTSEVTTATQALAVADRILVGSSTSSDSFTSGSSEATSSAEPRDGLPSQDSTRNPTQSNTEIDVTPFGNLATAAEGLASEEPLPVATLPNPSPSETSPTDLSLQNSSIFDTRERTPDESPSPMLSDDTSVLETSAEESATEIPQLEISFATTATVSTELTEIQSREVVDTGSDANSSRSLLESVDTDLEESDVNLEENIRTEIINESIQNARTGVVNVIPDFAAVPINQRRKRDSNSPVAIENKVTAERVDLRNASESTAHNGSMIFDDAIYACSGFGPTAIATIAILGAFCLILIYAFILVLCLPRIRRKKTVQISEKKLEEGEGEGIEIKEKPESVPPGPNGRISHCEDTLTTVDINNTERNADEAAAATNEDSKNEPMGLAEAETHNNPEEVQPNVNTTDEIVEENKETPAEESEPVKPILPPPPPPAPHHDHGLQEDKEVNEDPVETRPVGEITPETSPQKEPSPPPTSSHGEHIELDVSPQQHVPVFDELEPQEMIVKESIVNGANVELEDKSVDTVELESQDIEEPFDTTPPMISPEGEEPPVERLSPVAVPPEVKGSPLADERLSNGVEMSYNEQDLAPERDEMTKSIEDLPPPPPIPPHRTPPPPPPHADEMNAGLEAPDVVSSNVTAV
ncbi:uncharacterized protein LOC135475235 [Liolophura sinensis]|uniref:uncharacterized protein LOC135475235 n=1 Tax=Liolophura sinensis TaxID=3198878 RepID=UPI0031598C86